MTKVLFVCLGNICRSPLAEAIFNAQCHERGLVNLSSDSAGTASYHLGEQPDLRSIQVAQNHNIPIDHKARQFKSSDYENFDYVIALDQNNYNDIIQVTGSKHKNLFLLRKFDSESNGDTDVPDPYYGGIDGFQNIYIMMSRCIHHLLNHIDQ